ncbi:Mu transposase C-terminal domain-containing protein [Deefgea tanakiae]|uniref:Mu transposase C-terminal domain-containing protein n=1 Tax=Deefgea tanakiae TaxID=2865840 RepID=A0ABX8Z8P5_9NEIS|nr:Mu transposase C-terminal domain-containing protein [Deefgea tanakiae]QZA77468.1 Mu transposase C-terminal domain-containing protein [Deefgea tanakiae]
MSNQIRLGENALVCYEGENWRILHIQSFDRVLAARVRDGRPEFLSVEKLLPPITASASDSDSIVDEGDNSSPNQISMPQSNARIIRQLPPESELSPEQIQERQVAVEEFQLLLAIQQAARSERKNLIQQLCERFGYNEATAYRRLQIVKTHGVADALLRSVRSDVGKNRVKAEVIDLIQEHLKTHRFIPTPKTVPAILQLINGVCRKNGWQQISLSTLRKFEREVPLKQKLEAQGQKKKAADAFRTKAGHLPNKDYPLAIIQVDHTPLQICLVDEIDRLPIGDPWLTLVIDAYSRMVLGFCLTFDPPSTLSTGLALAHAFLPKEDYLRAQGVHGEWPCWGFPDLILVDNAAELNGRMMHGARQRYRFTLRDRPVGAPNFGGHVESAFRTFMYEFKSVPGTKFSNPVERGEYDSEGRSIFTIAEFESFFTEFLVNDYHLREHSGDGMEGKSPLLKWRQGVFEGDIMPPTGLPDRPSDPLSLRISLMPFERRTVRNGVINILAEEYHSGALTLISDAVDLTKTLEDRKFEVRYDPRNISKVWLYFVPNSNYIEVPFADLRKSPISLWERDARKRSRGNPTEQFLDQRYESQLRREDMKESAAKRTKRQRLEGDKARRRAQEALVQPAPPISKAQAKTPGKQKIDPDRLKALRDKVRAADPFSLKKEDSDDDR